MVLVVSDSNSEDTAWVWDGSSWGNSQTLDSTTGILVLEALMQTNRELGTTTAIITHNAPIQALAHRVLRFSDGRISEVTENTHRVAPHDIHW